MKNRLIIAIFVTLFLSWLFLYTHKNSVQFFLPQQKSISKVVIGETPISVSVVDNPIEREKGLSGTKNLSENSGMLFLFPKKDVYRFWMPDMNFPIDIIWIDENKVVDIDENVSNIFDRENPTYYSPVIPVDRVIEVNAFFVSKHNIKVGDIVS